MSQRAVLAAILAAAGWANSSVSGATLVVDPDGGGDYIDIQSAIDAAGAGDTVIVRAGEYVIAEPLSFNRLHDPGDPESPPFKDIVVRSDAGAGSTTIKMSETPTQFFRAAVILFEKGETSASTLEGFTLQGGGLMRWGRGWQEEDKGGVFCVKASSPSIVDCRVTGSSGEGLFCSESAPRVVRCEISSHSLKGMRCTRHSSATVTDSVFSRNAWGGIYCEDSSPSLANCAILQNGNCALNCWNSSPSFAQCTIAGNAVTFVGTIVASTESSPSFVNCIVWDNSARAIVSDATSHPVVGFSCIEAAEPWPGQGNIDADPLFCGWPAAELWVDASRAGPGQGTQADPYPSLAPALGNHRTSLRPDSPCLGSGEGGTDMGCASGPCEEPGSRDTTIHLSPGSYSTEGHDLSFHASLLGAGEDATLVEGPVAGSRTGTSLEDLAVVGGTRGGIVVTEGQAPGISRCTIANNSGSGVICGATSSPTLTSCTIRDNAGDTADGGGGVLCYNKAAPALIDCKITRNSAGEGGGIACRYEASPTLTGCSITENHASFRGGGVYCYDGSSARLTDCLIARNGADWYGDGVQAESSPVILTRCTIRENSGQGVLCALEPSPTLIDCTIAGNQAESNGGGIRCEYASPFVLNCVIAGNSTVETGGGLSLLSSSPSIVGCLIVGNSSGYAGGAVSCDESSPTMVHCTISENRAPVGGALSLSPFSAALLRNCILWDNTPQPVAIDGDATLAAQYSCLDPVASLPGEGNVHADPLFVQPGRWSDCQPGVDRGCVELEPGAWRIWTGGDYDLRAASPAIDTAACDGGVPDDLLGTPRSWGQGCDMGAIEHVGPRLDRFVRGDANDDGATNIADPVAILGFLFLGDPAGFGCPKSADTDDSGDIAISDAIALLGFLFLGTDPPASPFPECGVDLRADLLECKAYTGCR